MPLNQYHSNAPIWLQDNVGIRRILHKFLDQRDKGQQTKVLVKPKTTPELFDFSVDPDALWSLVSDKLCDEHAIVRVEIRQPSDITAQHYENARLLFNLEQEALVRQWLDRPNSLNYAQEWQRALQKHGHHLQKAHAFNTPLKAQSFSAEAILSGFINLQTELTQAHAF